MQVKKCYLPCWISSVEAKEQLEVLSPWWEDMHRPRPKSGLPLMSHQSAKTPLTKPPHSLVFLNIYKSATVHQWVVAHYSFHVTLIAFWFSFPRINYNSLFKVSITHGLYCSLCGREGGVFTNWQADKFRHPPAACASECSMNRLVSRSAKQTRRLGA